VSERRTRNSGSGGALPSVPTNQTMPNQQGGPTPASDYYTTAGISAASSQRTALGPAGWPLMTTKSSYNRLARVTR
jgi:hypothetical protein